MYKCSGSSARGKEKIVCQLRFPLNDDGPRAVLVDIALTQTASQYSRRRCARSLRNLSFSSAYRPSQIVTRFRSNATLVHHRETNTYPKLRCCDECKKTRRRREMDAERLLSALSTVRQVRSFLDRICHAE